MELKKEAPNTDILEANSVDLKNFKPSIPEYVKIRLFEFNSKFNDILGKFYDQGLDKIKILAIVLDGKKKLEYFNSLQYIPIVYKFKYIKDYPYIKLNIDDDIYKMLVDNTKPIETIIANRNFVFFLGIINRYKSATMDELLKVYNTKDINDLLKTKKYLQKLALRKPLSPKYYSLFESLKERVEDILNMTIFLDPFFLDYYLNNDYNYDYIKIGENIVINDIDKMINIIDTIITELQERPPEYKTLKEFVTITHKNELHWKLIQKGKVISYLANKDYLYNLYRYLNLSYFDVATITARKTLSFFNLSEKKFRTLTNSLDKELNIEPRIYNNFLDELKTFIMKNGINHELAPRILKLRSHTEN